MVPPLAVMRKLSGASDSASKKTEPSVEASDVAVEIRDVESLAFSTLLGYGARAKATASSG